MYREIFIQKSHNTIEEIQKALVESGSRFFEQTEIKKMSVEELLLKLIPNNVEFEVKHVSKTKQGDDSEE